ncbi:MAG: VanW family protein [Bacillota bacterium]|nr:VanW family protein [Bacillota bacterium]
MKGFKILKGWKKRFYLLFFLVLLISLALADMVYYQNRFYQGIYLNDIALGGKSLEEVEEILENMQITFAGLEGMLYSIPLKKIGIIISQGQMIREGYNNGRESPWPFNLLCRIQMKKQETSLTLHYHLDLHLMEQGLETLKNTFNSNPVDAHFSVKDKAITLFLEKQGSRILTEELIILLQNLNQGNEPLFIAVPLEILHPEVTALSLAQKGLTAEMSSFTTEFNPTAANRNHNISLAAYTLNNYIIAPGEMFSLNAVMGDTTAEKGYKEAPVILNGKIVSGIGGGLCQVSTTLYNAALLADLQVLERHNHLLTVPYVPPGRDATVSYGARDLKFRNNKEHYLQIISGIEENILFIGFAGSPLKEHVEIIIHERAVFSPPIRYEAAPELFQWEAEIIEGSPGYTVEVWKIVYLDNEEKSRKAISIDTYNPHPIIFRRGTKTSDSNTSVPMSIRILPAISP